MQTSNFWAGFEKRAEDAKPTKEEVDKANAVMAMSSLGSVFGGVGAKYVQRFFGKKLLKAHDAIPRSAEKMDIKNLKTHFQNATSKSLPKSNPKSSPLLSSLTSIGGVDAKRAKNIKRELEEIADLGSSFAKEHKLRESGIRFNAHVSRGKLGDYYNPIKNSVNMSTASRAVALHEMGHAADYRGSTLKSVGRRLPQMLSMVAVPTALAYGDQIKKRIPGTTDDKVIEFLQNNPVATGLAGYGLATLYPEAKASFSALKHISKYRGKAEMMKDLKKSLGPAYATYLAGMIPIAAGFGLANMYRKNLNKSGVKAKDESKPLQKAAAISEPARKAFVSGFLTASLPIGATTYYQYGTRGGRVINDIKQEQARQNVSVRLGAGMGAIAHKNTKKINETLEKHPKAVAAVAGIGGGTIAGLLTAYMTGKMPLLKKVARDDADEQASRPLPTYNSKAGPRLDEATVETDRSKFETFKSY